MPGGRPTSDPKGTLIAVRFAKRHIDALQRRARIEDTSLSEALRRTVDEWARIRRRIRQPTRKARDTVHQRARRRRRTRR